jgi:hypothetical protein
LRSPKWFLPNCPVTRLDRCADPRHKGHSAPTGASVQYRRPGRGQIGRNSRAALTFQSALRCPPVRAAAERARDRASLRGISRQPHRCRLPDGRELALSRAGAVGLMCMGPEGSSVRRPAAHDCSPSGSESGSRPHARGISTTHSSFRCLPASGYRGTGGNRQLPQTFDPLLLETKIWSSFPDFSQTIPALFCSFLAKSAPKCSPRAWAKWLIYIAVHEARERGGVSFIRM